MFAAGLRAEGLPSSTGSRTTRSTTNLAAHLDERTRIVWLETPTNPLMNVVDIRAAADAAHAAGAMVVVDNTFATPYLQQPLDARRRRRPALDDQVPRRPLRS